ncbi:MaoC/PaaZ C-terminal domain-containing protein [Pararoseomonas sp. SCSIO 73927]|uniref:MaoC/PaaZ C-terminal domain-containing protein n=1 Tax=Pararoseomonas sp. SCSIO 73927 TaxID=3114537 RepID=UPI0038D0B7D6
MTRVGDVHRFQRGPVTTTQLVMYAGASGDFNRIHFDLPYAQEAGLSAVLAHGMLTMGISVGCALQVAGSRFPCDHRGSLGSLPLARHGR